MVLTQYPQPRTLLSRWRRALSVSSVVRRTAARRIPTLKTMPLMLLFLVCFPIHYTTRSTIPPTHLTPWNLLRSLPWSLKQLLTSPGTGNLTQAEAEAHEAHVSAGATVAHDEGPAIKIVEPNMPVAKAAGESEFPAAEAEPSTKVVDIATKTGQYPSPIWVRMWTDSCLRRFCR